MLSKKLLWHSLKEEKMFQFEVPLYLNIKPILVKSFFEVNI